MRKEHWINPEVVATHFVSESAEVEIQMAAPFRATYKRKFDTLQGARLSATRTTNRAFSMKSSTEIRAVLDAWQKAGK